MREKERAEASQNPAIPIPKVGAKVGGGLHASGTVAAGGTKERKGKKTMVT